MSFTPRKRQDGAAAKLRVDDPTIEGLVKAWPGAPGALGIFTSEGGQFSNGYGMSQENRLKTAAACSEIWDGHPIKRVRAADGVSILRGRRLSMHLMIQPDAAAGFLSDPVLRDQGLLSRVLVAAPDSLAGKRLYRDTQPADDAAIKAYGARLLSLLETSWPFAKGKANELEPLPLSMSAECAAAWRAFFDHVEGQSGPGQDLSCIRDFSAKAAEHAARIAGVLTVVEDRTATEISWTALKGALTLADWYVSEATRLQNAARTDPRLVRAQHLLGWLRSRVKSGFSIGDVLQFGPVATRTKAAADDALSILIAHEWVEEVSARPRRFHLLGRED